MAFRGLDKKSIGVRDYSQINLPYVIAAWKVGYAIQMIVQAGMWTKLPFEVATKINDAYSHGRDLVVTKTDLDSLPDDAWEYLKSRL